MANEFAHVEIDHTPLDILVRDESGELVRPTLTTAICHFSKVVLGFHVSKGKQGRLPHELQSIISDAVTQAYLDKNKASDIDAPTK